MKIAVIGTPGGWSSERLADAVEAATGYRLLVDMSKISLSLPDGRLFYNNNDLGALDGILIKKIGSACFPDLLERLETLRYLSEKGMPIFSKPKSILRVLDRLACTITLQTGGIPMPPTTITEDIDAALTAVAEYGEAVFKPLYSTKARGMCVIKNGNGVRQEIETYHQKNNTMYIQKKIDLGKHDLGIVFLGGDYLITYARYKAAHAWNTTTASGGSYGAYKPSAEIIDLAHKAQSLFGLDFTCVDVALTSAGPLVFEVSAFGGFRGIMEAGNLDAAKAYTEYALERISQ
ncbi:MAG: GAK system ATP-grasp enzyme [Desulfosarcina sp.]|nr:GAK system ATP-grasp enzyme [Desulfobacterales bacterium]